MTMKPEDYEEFQRQLELEKLSSAEENSKDKKSKTKVDEDGTEYEWDDVKKAWFPKLSPELLLKFQSNYKDEDNTDKNQPNACPTYKDPQSNITYMWNAQYKRWIPSGQYDPKNPNIYKDSFGNVYEWDADNKTWKSKSTVENTNTSKKKSDTQDSTEKKEESTSNTKNNNDTNNNSKTDNTDVATYEDPNSNIVYKWNQTKWAWISSDGKVLRPAEASNQIYKDPKTGEVHIWDKASNKWVLDKTNKPKNEKKKSLLNKRKASQAAWFEANEENNTNVYVSGLPPDITEEEFAQFMTKCGIIMPNPLTQQPKVKLYKDKDNNLKGDGICCYLKKESIDLAINLLHDSEIRGGYKVKIEKAKFQLKGSYDASKKPKMLSKKEKKKLFKQNEKMLDWKLNRTETEVKKTDRVLIFKNMFHPKEFEQDPVLITDIRDDLKKECEKFGTVKKVIVFDRHTDGVCSVAFKDFEEALACQKSMNKRWFAGKQIIAEVWDGQTDYQIEETDKEREARMKNWEEFLEKGVDEKTQ